MEDTARILEERRQRWIKKLNPELKKMADPLLDENAEWDEIRRACELTGIKNLD